MRILTFSAFAGVSAAAIISAATAQAQSGTTQPSFSELDEIVVTARRKDESLQDVPTTINAVTGADIENLNIRKFEDLASVVPGLTMGSNANGIGAVASVRGVNYDVNASGNNGTIEFYLNDAPISAGTLFKTLYDIQQVELLRGPQGTLRGRASPSGSMTVTTRRADLQELGVSVNASGNNIGGHNYQGAFGVPIIAEKLAIRVAGVYDDNEGNRVTSFNGSRDPAANVKSGRVTVNFEPTDSLSFVLTGQKTQNESWIYSQLESQQAVFDPTAPVNPGAPGAPYDLPYITADSRKSMQDSPVHIDGERNDLYNLQAQWAFLGQKLNYVGARSDADVKSYGIDDEGDFFPSNYPANLQNYGQFFESDGHTTVHELRLSSEEQIAGMFNYIIGAFYQKMKSDTDLQSYTQILFGPPSPTVFATTILTPIAIRTWTEEKSAFANLTAKIGDSSEVSGGVRYIKYENHAKFAISGVDQASQGDNSDYSDTIFSVSAKHNFNDDWMVYATVGSSWRPGISVIGDFSLTPSATEISFLKLDPETSTSYELGTKFSALDNRLRGSVSVYHQKFDNYPYRSSSGVNYVTTGQFGPSVGKFNFVAAVPVEVNGIEAELAFAPVAAWDIGATAAYAKGEIKDGNIPCNDYAPRDGVPDSGTSVPTVTDILTATGGDTISACAGVSQLASSAPKWSSSIQSEYRLAINSKLNSFARGQVSVYGRSENDPTNAHDDYDGYALLNLYLGVRDPDSAWEVSLYGKNVTNTERVLTRSFSTLQTTYLAFPTFAGVSGATNYNSIRMTPPREFGVSLRYAFGSR